MSYFFRTKNVSLLLWAALVATSASSTTAPKVTEKAKALPNVLDSKELATLGEIDGEADDKTSLITIRLDRKPEWDLLGELGDHGAFLQLSLPNTLVPEPGKFIEANSPYIKKIAVFQMTPQDAAVRFFVTENAARTRDATSLELLDKRIVLAIDHDKLKRSAHKATPAEAIAKVEAASDTEPTGEVDALKLEPASKSANATKIEVDPGVTTVEAGGAEGERAQTSVASAASVIASTEVRTGLPAPSDLVKAEPAATGPAETGLGLKAFNLRDKLIQVSIFSGVLILLFVMSLLARPYMRRRAQGSEDNSSITMKTLATLPLAARQKISLIQVGDERILVGVTPEHVSFLTTLDRAPGKGSQRTLGSQPMVGLPPQMRASFNGMISDDEKATVEMRSKPVLKNIEGNDEASLTSAHRPRPQPTAAPAMQIPSKVKPERVGPPAEAPRRPKDGRINIAVSDDGIKDLGARKRATTAARAQEPSVGMEGEGESQKAIDDVTRLIREKLKNLRSI